MEYNIREKVLFAIVLVNGPIPLIPPDGRFRSRPMAKKAAPFSPLGVTQNEIFGIG